MFNYQYDTPERILWQEMGNELVPLVGAQERLKGRMAGSVDCMNYRQFCQINLAKKCLMCFLLTPLFITSCARMFVNA